MEEYIRSVLGINYSNSIRNKKKQNKISTNYALYSLKLPFLFLLHFLPLFFSSGQGLPVRENEELYIVPATEEDALYSQYEVINISLIDRRNIRCAYNI